MPFIEPQSFLCYITGRNSPHSVLVTKHQTPEIFWIECPVPAFSQYKSVFDSTGTIEDLDLYIKRLGDDEMRT